ncbi:MAG: hypothetical protein ACR2JW_03705 [Thermomicrobiales bacterium]
MDEYQLAALQVQRKSGTEMFHEGGLQLSHQLLDFWQWSCSDLTNNAMRGVLAEYLVALALGLTDTPRVEWNAFDLETADGLKIEVKSAAYLQTWRQKQLSTILFQIGQTFGWDASTDISETEQRRQADIYVFCVLKHQDKRTLDPLNMEQWDFYVLLTSVLNEKVPTQKTMGLSTLLRLNPVKTPFDGLAAAITTVAAAGKQ